MSERFRASEEHFKRASGLIPGASQTFSKSHSQFSLGASPLFVRRGKGCMLEDIDGNTLIDWTMGLGACLLGYAFEPVEAAIAKQLKDGTVYTLSHEIEYELASLLAEVIPCAEMVRFGKNGSDVTSAAVRVARAFTGRDIVACCGYHGWQDWYISTTTRNKGIPEAVRRLTKTFAFNNISSLEKLFAEHPGQIACVIMEPISLAPPAPGFLEAVRTLVHKNGALFIFDEVVTCFRMGLGGAQEYFNIKPDIACLGKAMANGLPVSAVVGRRDVMKLFDEIFFSFTFGGETLSIAAALATIRYLRDHKVNPALWARGTELQDGIRALIQSKGMQDMLSMECYPVRQVMIFKGEEKEALRRKTLLQQECVRRGLLFTGGFNASLPHDKEIISRTLDALSGAMDVLNTAVRDGKVDSIIEGKLLEPVFRKV